MKREIKFRAWNEATKRMTEGVSLVNMSSHFSFPLTWATMLQFVGQYDKNDKEIYEGDIVRYFMDERPMEETISHGIGEVKWDTDGFGVATTVGTLKPTSILFNSWDEFEVIGNIYENPELLTTPSCDKK